MTKIQKTKKYFNIYGKILLASVATAVALELFLIPSNVVLGGATGIASVLDIITGDKLYLSAAVWIVLVNVPIIISCYILFSNRFATRTLIYVVLLAVVLFVLRITKVAELLGLYDAAFDVSNRVVFTIIGGGLYGVSLPLMMNVNSSTGGSDIVALVVQRRKDSTSGDSMRYVLIVNGCVVLASALAIFFVFQDTEMAVTTFVYSIVALFISEIVQETIFHGFSAAIELQITTTKPQEVTEALYSEIKHGATLMKVKGAFSKEDKTVVVCVINRHQLSRARRVIRKCDEGAFAYVENVREVIGHGFKNKELEIEEERKKREGK